MQWVLLVKEMLDRDRFYQRNWFGVLRNAQNIAEHKFGGGGRLQRKGQITYDL